MPLFHACTLTLAWSSHLLCYPSSSASHPPSSGPVCHQCGVFCRCDGASDADPDSRGLHAVCRGVLQCVWALHGWWHQEREATRRRQQRWGRQEEFWESLWQGRHMIRVWISINIAEFTYMRKCITCQGKKKKVLRFGFLSVFNRWFMFLQQLFAEEFVFVISVFISSPVYVIQLWFSFDSLSLFYLISLLSRF